MRGTMLLVLPLLLLGCEPKGAGRQVGPLKDWVIGCWVRTDSGLEWNFNQDGEMSTGGRAPIVGPYSVEEPNKVQVRILGANAVAAGMQLGIAVDRDKGLTLDFIVKDDEMTPVGIPSAVVFKKR